MHLVLGHTVRDEHFATTNAVAHDFEITDDLLCDNAVASLLGDGPGLVFVFDSRKHGSRGGLVQLHPQQQLAARSYYRPVVRLSLFCAASAPALR